MGTIKIAKRGFLAVTWTFSSGCFCMLLLTSNNQGTWSWLAFFGLWIATVGFWVRFFRDMEFLIRVFWRSQYGRKAEKQLFDPPKGPGFWRRLKGL